MYQVFTIVAGSADPQGVLETPTHNAAASQPVTVSGWAIDAGTTSGTGVNAVEVYHCLYSNCSPTWTDAGAATYGGSRSDVAATYGPPFLNSGYSKSLSGLTPGPYAVFTYAHSTVSDTWRVLSALTYLDQGTSTLTIDRQGVGTGGVSATGLTCSGGSTTQGVPCSAGYTFNTSVTLTAVPDTGSAFGGWTGACTGTSTCTVTMAGAKYVAATFLPVAPNQGLTFYHTDTIGSVRALTDGSGTTITRHDYGAFGEDTAAMTGDPLRFGGKELDPETALENFEARYYRQTWGRFSQVDPVSGWATDPQSWNRYAYARNNPLRYTDPTGMSYDVYVDGGRPFSLSDEEFWGYSEWYPFDAQLGPHSDPFGSGTVVDYGRDLVLARYDYYCDNCSNDPGRTSLPRGESADTDGSGGPRSSVTTTTTYSTPPCEAWCQVVDDIQNKTEHTEGALVEVVAVSAVTGLAATFAPEVATVSKVAQATGRAAQASWDALGAATLGFITGHETFTGVVRGALDAADTKWGPLAPAPQTLAGLMVAVYGSLSGGAYDVFGTLVMWGATPSGSGRH